MENQNKKITIIAACACAFLLVMIATLLTLYYTIWRSPEDTSLKSVTVHLVLEVGGSYDDPTQTLTVETSAATLYELLDEFNDDLHTSKASFVFQDSDWGNFLVGINNVTADSETQFFSLLVFNSENNNYDFATNGVDELALKNGDIILIELCLISW